MAEDERTLCIVCAWRETCQKKFSFSSSGNVKCPDYTRDLRLPQEDKDTKKEAEQTRA